MVELLHAFALSQVVSIPLYLIALYGVVVLTKRPTLTNKAEERVSHKRVNWSAMEAVGFVVTTYVLSQVFGGLAAGAALALTGRSAGAITTLVQSSPGVQCMYYLFTDGAALWMTYIFLRRRQTLPAAIGWVRPRWLDLGYSFAGYAAYMVAYYVMIVVARSAFLSLNVNQSQDIGFSTSTTGVGLVMVFVSLVVLPPLMEEVLMRGVLYSGLKKQLPILWAALITSIIFAAAHLPESKGGEGLFWIGALDTFTLSMVLVYLREKTGSLWPGIGLHAIKNGIAFLVLFVFHLS
jgi:membrane protease YdiL (CAAX protease family)